MYFCFGQTFPNCGADSDCAGNTYHTNETTILCSSCKATTIYLYRYAIITCDTKYGCDDLAFYCYKGCDFTKTYLLFQKICPKTLKLNYSEF